MNMLPKKTLLESLKWISSLAQQGVISKDERDDLIKIANSYDYDSLFSKVNQIFDRTENLAAKRLLDIMFQTN